MFICMILVCIVDLIACCQNEVVRFFFFFFVLYEQIEVVRFWFWIPMLDLNVEKSTT